ncbi:MAG: hypothetical protein IPJ69_00850 [Deltaproteobacteria bacterium]|nr:MAG: hypothetical protein IPJ69_00850 [Deltaproteobacteria bacterium]
MDFPKHKKIDLNSLMNRSKRGIRALASGIGLATITMISTGSQGAVVVPPSSNQIDTNQQKSSIPFIMHAAKPANAGSQYAYHTSHASHASHESHYSHYSSR